MGVFLPIIGGKIKITPTDYEQLINYTMLYDNGDECEEITGGWEAIWRDTKYFSKNN